MAHNEMKHAFAVVDLPLEKSLQNQFTWNYTLAMCLCRYTGVIGLITTVFINHYHSNLYYY